MVIGVAQTANPLAHETDPDAVRDIPFVATYLDDNEVFSGLTASSIGSQASDKPHQSAVTRYRGNGHCSNQASHQAEH